METRKKGLLYKTWKRCLSLGDNPTSKIPFTLLSKSKSWSYSENSFGYSTRKKVAPQGCFSVYVGTQKQKFVIKTGYVNHSLFAKLLEEAEMEYGYSSEGPITLPCNVDMFVSVLSKIDQDWIRHRCKS